MVFVRDLVNRHVVAVSGSTSVGSALKLMKHSRVSVIPVLRDGVLLGVISREELEAEDEKKKVGENNHRLLYLEESDDASTAAKAMVSNRISRLPVVNNRVEMKCVGIVSSTELARHHKRSVF